MTKSGCIFFNYLIRLLSIWMTSWGLQKDDFSSSFTFFETPCVKIWQCEQHHWIAFFKGIQNSPVTEKKNYPPPKKNAIAGAVHGGSLKSTFKIPLISWVNPPFVSIPAESASFFQPFSLQILSPDEVSSKHFKIFLYWWYFFNIWL